LLEYLVVGGEPDLEIELQFREPESQSWLEGFGGESGADGKGGMMRNLFERY
jgi:hypothetical protein